MSSNRYEYLISRHHIWAVLCKFLYDQQGSLKSVIKVTLLVAYLSGILSKLSTFAFFVTHKELSTIEGRLCTIYPLPTTFCKIKS